MKNLRQLFRRSRSLSSAQRTRRAGKARRSDTHRRLRSESLEQRQLLAGDLANNIEAPQQNGWNRFDVNDDGQITLRDALNVFNELGRKGEGEAVEGSAMFVDVNGDNTVTSLDALNVINAVARGEQVTPLLELILTARDLNDNPIVPDANGHINLEVGQQFELEVAYDDLRTFNDRRGAFQLFTDISMSQAGALLPVFNETQRLVVDSTILDGNWDSVTLSIPNAPPNTSGGALIYTSSFDDFFNDPESELINALLAFGYTEDQFKFRPLDFDNVIGPGSETEPSTGDPDFGWEIHWVGDEFGNVDLPRITLEVNETAQSPEVPTLTREIGPFLSDGVTPDPAAARFNINTLSRTFNDNESLYNQFPDGQFDGATGYTNVGGTANIGLGATRIQDLTEDGRFLEPFDTFSLRVFINQPVSNLQLDVGPGSKAESVLLFGRDDEVDPELFLLETVDSKDNGTARVTVHSADPGDAVLSIALESTLIDEEAGTATLTVHRALDSQGQVTVDFTTVAGTATAGSDFTATSGTLTFGDTELSKTITVPIGSDTLGEGNEIFTVELSNVTGDARLGVDTATVTIVDDDNVLAISPTTTSVSEAGTSVTLTVNRSGNTSGTASVDFTTNGVSAVAGDDFASNSGTLNFADNETSKTIVVTIKDDNEFEGDETFTVTLSNPSDGQALGNATSTVTIIDDEQPQRGTLSIASTASVNEDGGSISLTVNRTGGDDGTVTIDFATSGGTATSDTDFTSNSGTLTFGDGETSKTIDIQIDDDNEDEGDETFTVTLSNETGGATRGNDTSTVTIVEDDIAGTLEVASTSVNEDVVEGTVTVTVNRTGGSDGTVMVDYATGGGTATAGVDYTSASGTLTFAHAETSKTIVIDIADDDLDEGNETFDITLSNPTGGADIGVNPGTVTILNDDSAGTLSIADASVNEDAGSLTLTVNRTDGDDGTLMVDFATSEGTATADVDYTSTSGTLTFGDGETSKDIVIPITDDDFDDDNEMFTVSLSNVSLGGTLGNSTSTVTILDDDSAGTLSIDDVSVNESAGTVTLTVNRINGNDGTVEVDFASSAGSATADVDYTSVTGTLVFGDSETSKDIVIQIADDKLDEEDETFTVSLSGETNGALVGNRTATVTILDDDTAGTLSFTQATRNVEEGGSTITLTVERTGGSDGDVAVDFATNNGTALAVSDYVAQTGTLNFADQETSKTIEIQLVDDQIEEVDPENFTVTLSNPTNRASIGTGTSTITIFDDDIPGTLAISQDVSVAENGGSVTLTVERFGGDDGTVTVDFATADGTAIAGLDYESNSGTLTFGDSETSKEITIVINEDVKDDDDETFTVVLSNVTGGASLPVPTSTVTIIDNDENLAPVFTGPLSQDDISEEDPQVIIDLLAGATDPNEDELSVVDDPGPERVSGDVSGISFDGNSLIVDPSAYTSLGANDDEVIIYNYQITDGVNSVTQTITITINGFNDSPVAPSGVFAAGVLIDTTTIIQINPSDDEDGNELTVVDVQGTNGTAVVNQDGTISFTPDTGFTGQASFSYTVRDSEGAESTGTITFEVRDFEPSSLGGALFIDHVENIEEIVAGGAPIRNGIKDADERGLMGVPIRLDAASGGSFTVLTDANGNYRFTDLAPDTYTVVYEVPDTVVFVGGNTYTITIPEAGGTNIGDLNFALHATRGDALDKLDILASTYVRDDDTPGVREGGLVSLDASGDQNFMVLYAGFEGIKFAELTLNAGHDAALLTIVEDDNDVFSARITDQNFVVTPNGRGVQFFGGIDDMEFFAADASVAQEFANYRNAVDQVLAQA